MQLDATCGSSDERNKLFTNNFNLRDFYTRIFGANQSPVIFDIGAHHGESINHFTSIFASPSIHSFEPDPENYKILQGIYSNNNNVASLNNLAISSSSGSIQFYKQQLSHLGSVYKINHNSIDSLGFASSADNYIISVDAVSLNDYMRSSSINVVDLIKIDVQGHEYDVLVGASSALSIAKCVAIEICLFDFYEHKTSLVEVFQLLYSHGFTLYSIPKVSQNPVNLRSDWFEAIFVK